MKNKTFILIIFLCFLPLFCKGQFCKLYSTHGDISSSMINHIYQDSKGYIWVSTEDGLNKYDGAKFVNYKNHFNDSTSDGTCLRDYIHVCDLALAHIAAMQCERCKTQLNIWKTGKTCI